MPRFILRFVGKGDVPVDDIERWRSLPKCHIVDESSRMLLVDAEEKLLRGIVESHQDWQMTRETTSIRIPDPRPKIKKSPSDR